MTSMISNLSTLFEKKILCFAGNSTDDSTEQTHYIMCNCTIEEHYSNAAALLNANPQSKQAENYLIEQGLVDPQHVHLDMAKFIWNHHDLFPRFTAWNYLQRRDNIITARVFMNLLDLSKPVPAILKELFSKACPDWGGAPERGLEILSQEFYRANPHLVPDADAACRLVMGTMALRIDLHHPRGSSFNSNKEQWFKSMNEFGSEIDVHLLEQIYHCAFAEAEANLKKRDI